MIKQNPLKFVLIVAAIIVSLACCMLPKTYKGSIEQTQQEGIIIYDKGIEDLILKVDPKITGVADLKDLCWLITVPNEPDKYNVCEPDIFRSFYQLKNKHLVRKIEKRKSFGCSEKTNKEKASDAAERIPGVELGTFVQVGDYDIQPVRGVGKHALSGLNKWLDQNGYPTEPEEHMKYFVDNKFTFLCIKINSKEGEKIDSTPDLKPLHLTFKSDQVYYPMKYSSQQGDFSANIYTITSMPIDYKKSAEVLKRLNWKNTDLYKNVNLADKFLEVDPPKAVRKALDGNKPYLYFNNFNCSHPNRDGAISKWTEDIFFKLNDSHWPNSANMMKGQISWIRTGLLILGILIVFIVARRKWKKTYTSESPQA